MAFVAIPRTIGSCLVAFLIVCAVGSSCSSPQRPSQQGTRSSASSAPSNDRVRLQDWGLQSADQVGFVSIGLRDGAGHGSNLAVYDLRKTPPSQRETNTVVRRSQTPRFDDGVYLLSRFDTGNYNRLGGTFSAYQRAPSSGRTQLAAKRGGLQFRYDRRDEGYVGFWMHLFDDRVRPEDRSYLHSGQAAFISLEIHGTQGGELLSVRVADRSLNDKGGSKIIGELERYLPAGQVTKRWQRALIPLADLPPGIAHEELAVLVLAAERSGRGQVMVRNLALVVTPESVVPKGTASTTDKKTLRRAIWVWNTKDLVGNAGRLAQLLRYCSENEVTDVYLQLLASQEKDGKGWRRRSAEDLENMLPLVAALHKIGVRVDALDGDPAFSLRENHEEALDIVRAVIRSNRKQPPLRRFDGVRFDNEPYLLPGFAGPDKEAILRDYLLLLTRTKRLTGKAKLTLGADIPFWLDGYDRFLEPIAQLDGRPLSELVIDRVDNIAVMAYRTSVYGPDAVIAHSLDELEYAEKSGKEVFIALETGPLPDERLLEFTKAGVASAKGEFLLLRPQGTEVQLLWFDSQQEKEALREAARVPKSQLLHLAFEALAPADKLTFNKRGREALRQAIEQIGEELKNHKSMVGFALHDFSSLVRLGESK